MYRPDGWVVQRAKEVKGKFINGEDHKFYQIGEKQFQDAMRFSRDNIIISNRCGEYLNTHKYFGLLNMKDDSEVSLWFIHSTDKNRYGAPCGFTSGRFGRYFLLKAIECSKKKLDSIIVDENGKNLQKGQKYVNRINHERFKNLIMRAEKICDTRYPSEIHDYNTNVMETNDYNTNIKKVNCSCEVKESTNSYANMNINKTKLYENFGDQKDNTYGTNLGITSCDVFSSKENIES